MKFLGRETPQLNIQNGFSVYYEVTKPKIIYLLVFTALGAMITGAGGIEDPIALVSIVGAVWLGSAGANTLTSFIDRDIDAVMNRTRNRPIPSGRIVAHHALYFGLLLSVLSMLMAYLVSPLSAVFMGVGLFDNVVVYSLLSKRRTSWNIILGGFSGGMPVLVGYAALRSPIRDWWTAIAMAALVVLWIPTHIWSLALKCKEDYGRARVPMLPVVTDTRKAVRCIGSTSLLMAAFSVLLYPLGQFGLVYLIAAVALGGLLLGLSFWLIARPTEERAWILFKFSSPYLAAIFIVMMVDSILL